MKTCKIVSCLLVLLGAILFAVAMYAKVRVKAIKSTVDTGSKFFSHNPIDQGIGKGLDAKFASYNTPIVLGMVGGVVLVAVGLGVFIYGRRR